MLAINIKSDLGNKLPRYLNSLFEKFHVFWAPIFTIYLLAYSIVWKFYNKRASVNNIWRSKRQKH